MPYISISDLPENVTNVLPKHAQDVYKEAFNSAYEEYKNPKERAGDDSRETVAHKVAWSAVKKIYEKGTDATWHRKKNT